MTQIEEAARRAAGKINGMFVGLGAAVMDAAMCEQVAAVITTELESLPAPSIERLRNQAENIIDSVLGVDKAPYSNKHSDRHELREQIATALSVAHKSASLPSERERAQVFVFQPELTHSVWIDFVDEQPGSHEETEQYLREGVERGRYVGYRFIRIEEEHIGRTWK